MSTKNVYLFYLVLIVFTEITFSQDWSGLPVPAESGNSNYSWELVDALSDSFNYETPFGSNKGATFNTKWKDGFINSWPGFGKTIWSPNNSRVFGGNLELKATSLNASNNTNNFSAIHARTEIIYPVFIETRMKIMNAVMANAVWLLSENSREEIDIVEAYGSSFAESNNTSREWFARRMHLSHHTFSANKADYQPTDAGSWYVLPENEGKYWRNGFHRVGMYWRDPFHLEYYIDGKLVRTVSGPSIIDPNEHLDGNGLSLPEKIIFSGAAQQWMVNGNVYPTVNELSVESNNIFQVDWIRTYKRVNSSLSTKKYNIREILSFSNPVKDYITIHANADLKQLHIYQINGVLVKSINNNLTGKKVININDLSSGIYIIKAISNSGKLFSGKVIKN